jgi:hypothetical protein
MNKWIKFSLGFLVLCSFSVASAQKIKRIEYFIDTDPGFGKANAVKGHLLSNDISDYVYSFKKSLPSGNHVLGVRSKDSAGRWSHTNLLNFNTIDTLSKNPIDRIEMFVDRDSGFGKSAFFDVVDSTDVLGLVLSKSMLLSVGNHILGLRSRESRGKWSHTNFLHISILDTIPTPDLTHLEYYWDNDPGFNGSSLSEIQTPAIDLEDSMLNVFVPRNMSVGKHNLFIRSKSSDERWSHTNHVEEYDVLELLKDTIFKTANLLCESYTTKNGLTFLSDTQLLEAVLIKGAVDVYQIYSYDIKIDHIIKDSFSKSVCDGFLSPSGKYFWEINGVYIDTVLDSKGCDTIYTIRLTVNKSNHIGLKETACKSYTSPSGGYVWTTSGTYLDTLVNENGCDSVLTIDLTVRSFDRQLDFSSDTIKSRATATDYQWLDCNNDFVEISGETNQYFVPINNGRFAVEIKDQFCIDTSDCELVDWVNLLALTEQSINLYPNPARDYFVVEIRNILEPIEIDIMDVVGKKVFSTTSNNSLQIPVAHWKPGAYVVRFRAKSFTKLSKLIVE